MGYCRAVDARFGRLAMALVGAAVIAIVLLGLTLEGRPILFVSRGGVVLERLGGGELPAGDKVQGKVDDYRLGSDSAQVIVGGSRATPERRAEYGSLIDVTGSVWPHDGLTSAQTVMSVKGRLVPISTDAVVDVTVDGLPAIQVTQNALRPRMTLYTLIRVFPGKPHVEVVTRATNREKKRVTDLRVGDRIEWPGVEPFAPGLGEVSVDGSAQLSWFARPGEVAAYAWVYPDAPAFVEFRDTRGEPYQLAWSRVVALEPGQRVVHRRLLVAGWQGMAHAAELAWRELGRPLGRVVGQLVPPPSSATLTAVAAGGEVTLSAAVPPHGRFDWALPPGRSTLVLRSPGGVTDTLVDVTAGEATPAEFVVPRAGRLQFRVTDRSGMLIPARLVITGIAGTAEPIFGPDYRAAGASNEVHSATGAGEVEIPPGRYSVLVTRGPEYSVVRRTVDIFPEQGAVLPVVLLHEVPTPGWLAADLHLHALPSYDSEVTLADRIATLLAAGVEFAVASDHNHVTDYAPTINEMAVAHRIGSTVGVEITTKTWGHFNVYPLRPDERRPAYADIAPQQIFAEVRRRPLRPILQVNHPWMAGYGYFHRAGLDPMTGIAWKRGFSYEFDALEVVNGKELINASALERNLHRWFQLLNQGRRYTAVGNSDSHKVVMDWAGYPRTYLGIAEDDPARVDAADVAAAIRAGRTVVSNGPFLEASVSGVGPGGLAPVSAGKGLLWVRVSAADWVDVSYAEVFVNGEVADVLPAGGPPSGSVRLERTVELSFERDSWLVVLVRGFRELDPVLPGMNVVPFAFNNPIYVDANTDGVYDVTEPAAPTPPPPAEAIVIPPEDAGIATDAMFHPPSVDAATPGPGVTVGPPRPPADGAATISGGVRDASGD